ncbi:DUF2399 domain-containing protein [Streptomyces sp. NPDC089424]|uniref:DUF2399 domain-containing protein n=1 Tax=Streptomyces sp. NPDC089424 TaxID=3365917 RepID=UPI00381183B6
MPRAPFTHSRREVSERIAHARSLNWQTALPQAFRSGRGQPVSAAWDQHLAPAMNALGVALHKEVTLDLLADDLPGRT